MAAFINSATLLMVAFFIAREAVERLSNPVEIGSEIVIVLAFLSIVINGGSVLLLKKDAKNNLNIKSAYLHLFTDMMTSAAVLGGGVAMYFFQIYWLDSIISIILAFYLLYSSWGLVKQTMKVLMQFAPPDIDIDEIRNTILEQPEIKNVHHVHLWQLNEKEFHLEAHLEFKNDTPLSRATSVIEKLNIDLDEKFHICHTVFQPEFNSNHAQDLIVNKKLN